MLIYSPTIRYPSLYTPIHPCCMKTFFYLLFLFLVSQLAAAQAPRTDVLYKLDKKPISVKVDELTDSTIVYFEPPTSKVKKKIARRQVWKIVFSDGSTELITPLTASKPTTDQITLVDQTVVSGKVVRRDAQKLYYTKPNDPTKAQYALLLSRLDRVRYADGRVENLRKPAAVTPPVAVVTPPQPAPSAPAPVVVETPAAAPQPEPAAPRTDYSARPPAAMYTNSKAFAHIHLTVGPELAYFPESTNKQWGDVTAGLGMNQNVGGSVRFDFRFVRAVAISFTGGYNQWQLVRNYLQNGTEKYDETIKLTRIPLQAGLKFYAGGLYLMPEAGVNLLTTTVKTSATHPSPSNQQNKATPVTYGASLGYEISAGGLLVDISARYQLLDVKNLNFGTVSPALTERIQFASVRLGIGFNALRK